MHIWKLNLFAMYSWTPTDLYIHVSVALASVYLQIELLYLVTLNGIVT